MDWHVLYLRPRCEKKMAEHCRILDLKYYLPLRSQTKVYQRRKVTVEMPVFPGYIFAAFDREGRVGLLRTNNIVRILEPPRKRELLHQLAQVRKALAADPSLGACAALKSGRLVRILSGPFMGVEGMVSKLKGTTKVCLNVELIGQAVAVEVDRECLEVID
jgi:transcription antitermination factor NusG